MKQAATGIIIVSVIIIGWQVLKPQKSNSMKGDNINRADSSSVILEVDSTKLYVEYSEGGAFGEYADGDIYGSKIRISYDGDVFVYDRIYHALGNESEISDRERKSGKLSSQQFTTLKKQVESAKLSELPKRLPDVSPLEVPFRSPAEKATLIYQPKSNLESVEIRINYGADLNHYPDGFMKLRQELRRLMEEL